MPYIGKSRERKRYECVNAMAITDYGSPAFCIDVGQAIDMDEEERQFARNAKRE